MDYTKQINESIGKLFAIALLIAALTAPVFAFEVRPNPNMTSGSVRIDGHDVNATCGRSKAHRGSMGHARRDEILKRYGLPPGEHPDYEIRRLQKMEGTTLMKTTSRFNSRAS